MVMNSYVGRLGKVFANLDHATQQTITHGRKFLRAEEDPASTARAYQLRKNFQQNDDFLNNVKDVLDTMDSIDASMMVISKMAESAHATLTEGRNGVWSIDDRMIFANELRTMQRTAVDALNAKFDDKFLFGGSSTKTLPFELIYNPDGSQTLTFRGLDITDPANQAKLKEYSEEKIYIDMGFGLTVDIDPVTGLPAVKDSSAFNTSIPGLNLVGFGVNPEDNFILNLGLIANELEVDPHDYDATKYLWEKLTSQRMNILAQVTRVGADYNFLEKQRGVLEVNNDNLNEKILNVEFMDLEEAIMNLKMADYIYRAALEMGTKILTPSFIDFMR
jgi:flagellar hook-associated protein 3 FlgL